MNFTFFNSALEESEQFELLLSQTGQPKLFYNHKKRCFLLENDQESSLISKELVSCIIENVLKYQPYQLFQQINETVHSKKNHSSYFEINRCPYLFYPITETRSLCITIIPSELFIKTYLSEYTDFCQKREVHIKNYYESAELMHRINPKNTIPFVLIDNFISYTLVVSEGITDIYYPCNLDRIPPRYLMTEEHIKDHLIDPCLNTIKTIHAKGLIHGDPTSSNVTLPVNINKLLFWDFKHLLCKYDANEDKNLAKLTDFFDISNTINQYMISLNSRKNPAIFYLKKIIHLLGEIIEKQNEVDILFLGLTIDKIKEEFDFFWKLPEYIFDYVSLDEIADYRPMVPILFYDKEHNKFILDDYPNDQSLDTDLLEIIKTKIKEIIKFKRNTQTSKLTNTKEIRANFIKDPNGKVYNNGHYYTLEISEWNDFTPTPSSKKKQTVSFQDNLRTLQEKVITNKAIQADSSDPHLLSLLEKMKFYNLLNDFPDMFMAFPDPASDYQNCMSLYEMITRNSGDFVLNNLGLFYLKRISSLFEKGAYTLFYSKTLRDICDCIHSFWDMPASNVLCYNETKLSTKQIDSISCAYLAAIANEQTDIMAFYEACYPDYLDISSDSLNLGVAYHF